MLNPLSRRRRCPARTRASQSGFTLVEILVSIGVVSILVAACIPRLTTSKRQALAAAVAGDLRTFATAFETYAQEHGGFPPDVAAGEMVPEMADRLGPKGWLKVTPIGGQYNWESDQVHYGTRYKAAIQISQTGIAPLPEDVELWEAIDKMIDDGNLSTGIFRLGAGNEPLFIIAQ